MEKKKKNHEYQKLRWKPLPSNGQEVFIIVQAEVNIVYANLLTTDMSAVFTKTQVVFKLPFLLFLYKNKA